MAEPVDEKAVVAPEILTIREVAGYLKLPVSTVYRLAERRDLPATRSAGNGGFHKSVLDDWFRAARRHQPVDASSIVDDEEAIRELMVTALATKTWRRPGRWPAETRPSRS